MAAPIAGAMEIEKDQETTKSGKPGKKVMYTIDIKNDKNHPVDIKAVIEETEWNASITKDEFRNVRRNKVVRFKITV
ncbi:MAG: hypothetical protein KAU14_01815, partial [Thermoplasmata archaeon]|nr:hypothetical protein [Thermoplasmata archaeon]